MSDAVSVRREVGFAGAGDLDLEDLGSGLALATDTATTGADDAAFLAGSGSASELSVSESSFAGVGFNGFPRDVEGEEGTGEGGEGRRGRGKRR